MTLNNIYNGHLAYCFVYTHEPVLLFQTAYNIASIKVYKSCIGSCWALKSLITKFEQQLAQLDKSTDIADYFLKDYNGRTLLFVMAVTPFLFDMRNDQIRGVFNFSEVYPSSKTNLNDYLHLLQAFLTSTAKTNRTFTLSTRRWIVSALLHSLKSNDDTYSVINVNSFFAHYNTFKH